MRDRKGERARRKQQFAHLRLQADILYDSHKESEQTIVLGRMMQIILDIVGNRSMNSAKRQALADHFTDCALSPEGSIVQLGGQGDRDTLSLSGDFSIGALAKRITWSEARGTQTIEVDHARN